MFSLIHSNVYSCDELLIRGSEVEKQAIRSAYMGGRGQLAYVMKHVPFSTDFDKQRIKKIVEGSMNDNYFNFLVWIYFIAFFCRLPTFAVRTGLFEDSKITEAG